MKVSEAPPEKTAAARSGARSRYQRMLSDKEKEQAAIEDMFSKAKRLNDEDEPIAGIPTTGNTDAGYDDDDWN